MFTWPTLGEGLQAEGTFRAKAERCEQAHVRGRPGIQRLEISHGGFLTPTMRLDFTGIYERSLKGFI